MQPRPIRMPDSLWSELEAEAEAADLSTAAYVRRLLRNRPDAQETTDAVADRLDELERRVAALEADPITQKTTTDHEPITQADTQADTISVATDDPYGEQNERAVALLRASDEPLRKAEIVETVDRDVGIPIVGDSWWTTHGRPAIRDAGAQKLGKKWKL